MNTTPFQQSFCVQVEDKETFRRSRKPCSPMGHQKKQLSLKRNRQTDMRCHCQTSSVLWHMHTSLKAFYNLESNFSRLIWCVNNFTFLSIDWHMKVFLMSKTYCKVSSSRPVYYSILNYLGQRSQCISIKFPLLKNSENDWVCYYPRQSTVRNFTVSICRIGKGSSHDC